MRVRSWKRQLLLLCPVKLWRIVGVMHPTKSRQNLHVFWKLMNPQECVWEIWCRIITKTILQEKVRVQHNTTIWSRNLFLCLKLWKFLQQRQEWTRKEKNWKRFRNGTWRNSEVRNKWSMKHGHRAHFASLMDTCRLKNAELETKHQEHKGRLVLQSDMVKDDSGSYAVITEQWSSTFQMTAAKIMDIISRLPDCDGQTTDAISAYTQAKNGRCSQIFENSQIGVHLDSSTTTQMAKIMVHHGRSNRSPWKEFCMVIFWQDCHGKSNLTISCWNAAGRKFTIGNVSLFIVKRDHSYLCLWMTENWLERNKLLIRCGKHSTKKLIWENQRLSSIMYTWCALKDHVKQAKMLQTISEPCSNCELARGEKLPFPQNLRISSWSCDMTGHAKKCVELHFELANNTTQQLYKVFTPCTDDLSLQRRRKKTCWRNVKSVLSNCSEMLALGTHWKTQNSMVSGQTCTIDRKMEKKLVTNDYLVWSLTTHVIADNIVMWETLPKKADWDCFKTLISWEILKIRNPLLEEHCAFLEVVTHLFH